MTKNQRLALVDNLIEVMDPMSTEERLEMIKHLHNAYCKECGARKMEMGYACQCWNDE